MKSSSGKIDNKLGVIVLACAQTSLVKFSARGKSAQLPLTALRTIKKGKGEASAKPQHC